MLLASIIIGANFVDSAPLVIMFMAIAFFANGLASIHWSLVSAVAPERLIGLTSGTFNFVGSLAFITTPIIIGHLLTTGSISGPLTFFRSPLPRRCRLYFPGRPGRTRRRINAAVFLNHFSE